MARTECPAAPGNLANADFNAATVVFEVDRFDTAVTVSAKGGDGGKGGKGGNGQHGGKGGKGGDGNECEYRPLWR